MEGLGVSDIKGRRDGKIQRGEAGREVREDGGWRRKEKKEVMAE